MAFYTALAGDSLRDKLVKRKDFEELVTRIEAEPSVAPERLPLLCQDFVGRINELDTQTRGKFLSQSHVIELKLEADPKDDPNYIKTFTDRFNANWDALLTYYRVYASASENTLKKPIFGVKTKFDLLTVLTEWKDRELKGLTSALSYSTVLSKLTNLTQEYLGYMSEEHAAADYPKVCNYF